jgi:hypothetical protein
MMTQSQRPPIRRLQHPDRAWAMLTIAEFGLCLNWALTAAILLAVILPRRRSLAESLQILCSHVFGDGMYVCARTH